MCGWRLNVEVRSTISIKSLWHKNMNTSRENFQVFSSNNIKKFGSRPIERPINPQKYAQRVRSHEPAHTYITLPTSELVVGQLMLDKPLH